MLLPALFISTLFFGIISIVLSIQEEKIKKILSKQKHLIKTKDDMTNIVVHELRAPLTAIKNSSELMIKNEFDEMEEKKLLNLIDEQAKKLLEKITLFLDAAKMRNGQFSISKQPSDINRLVLQEISIFTPSATTKHILLSPNLSQGLPLISFDPVRIGEVINNLVSNSLKFTPEGGKITISTEKRDNYILISVSDTGVGIAKEKQGQLFEKFSQVYEREHENEVIKSQNLSSGTGLGLYISKTIVQAHGGSIFLNSEVNQGTTVSFTLPISMVSETEKINLEEDKAN